jgi:hypothetical protein
MFFDINLLASGTTIPAANLFLLNYDAISEGGGGLALIEAKINKVSSAQMNTIFEQAMKYYKDGYYENSSKYFSAVYTADPSRTDAKNYYEFFNKRVKKQTVKKIKKITYI